MIDAQIAPGEWRDHHDTLRDDGGVLETLTVVDRGEALEVIAVVRSSAGARMTVTSVPADAPALTSLAAVFPAADWLEREAAEMFGVTFTGHPDPRPLLLRDDPAAPPLRRAAPLRERLAVSWPGAREVSDGKRARRPALPPGVRQEWVAKEREHA